MLNNLKPTGVIDLGAYEIKCIIFLIKEGETKILAKSIIKTQGIKRGLVSDLNKLSYVIKEVIGTAEDQAKVQIQDIYLAPSTLNIYNSSFGVFKNIGGYEIEQEKDVQFLINSGVDLFRELNQNFSIIHLINSNLKIDKFNQVENPIDLVADSLEIEMFAIYLKNNFIKNFQKIINKSYLNLEKTIYSPYVLGFSSYLESPLSDFILLIDFGHEKTSISIFKNKNFLFASTIPIGSFHVTNDISKALNLDIKIADDLKVNHGSCVLINENFSNKYIENENLGIKSYKKVSNSILNKIIISRVEEIIDYINNDLFFFSKNYNSFNKILITGEGSKIHDFETLLKNKLNIKAFVIEKFDSSLKKELADSYDVCVAMINYIKNPYIKEIVSKSITKKNFFEQIYSIFN